MKEYKYLVLPVVLTTLLALPLGWWLGSTFGLTFFQQKTALLNPFIENQTQKKLPLLQYTIENLRNYPYQTSQIKIGKVLGGDEDYTSYLFTYHTLEKTMSGQLNLPTTPAPSGDYPVVILVRGYVPPEIYEPGVGTKSAAEFFAKKGYTTLAPDFFGFGESDEEAENPWEARFQKPMNVIELIASLQKNPTLQTNDGVIHLSPQTEDYHLWAHSNGGQIALATLEISGLAIPTTLWAPVTAPFPYSVLFYSDEHDDEGKATRAWLSIFEKDYDVFEFSLTQHLSDLRAPLQIHQGTSDDAVPVAWNDEFVEKLEAENKRREEVRADQTATNSAKEESLEPIEITYYRYPGADHNLQPSWNQAIQRDLGFFEKN